MCVLGKRAHDLDQNVAMATKSTSNRENVERAKRLYADARRIEQISTDRQAKELAGGIALLALDMLAEARGGEAAS